MPRYGEAGYDPDFDDSPPPTPKYRPPPPPRWHSWYWTVRRNRGLIIFSIFFFYTLRFLSHWRQPIFTPAHAPALRYKNVDWRAYAYSQYATDSNYLCNSLMVFDSLDRLGSKASRLLMYPQHMDTKVHDANDRDSQLLLKARDEYGAVLQPIELKGKRTDNWNDPKVKSDLELSMIKTWDLSVSKFLAFGQTQYLRILHIDSDVTILKNMDDLFLSPSVRVAMPRAYWKLPKKRAMTPLLLLLEPSEIESERLMDVAESETRSDIEFDMEILNELYRDSAAVLPHRAYGLLSSEFRNSNHSSYHGNEYEAWDPDRALAEASLVHFSDGPLPKPWVMWPTEQMEEMRPECNERAEGSRSVACRNQRIWLNLYNNFRKRRQKVCGYLPVPAPKYKSKDHGR